MAGECRPSTGLLHPPKARGAPRVTDQPRPGCARWALLARPVLSGLGALPSLASAACGAELMCLHCPELWQPCCATRRLGLRVLPGPAGAGACTPRSGSRAVLLPRRHFQSVHVPPLCPGPPEEACPASVSNCLFLSHPEVPHGWSVVLGGPQPLRPCLLCHGKAASARQTHSCFPEKSLVLLAT